jgi:hypothetical protein
MVNDLILRNIVVSYRVDTVENVLYHCDVGGRWITNVSDV